MARLASLTKKQSQLSLPNQIKMAITSNSNTKNHVRSISLPSRTNPKITGIEEELNKLKTRVISSSPTTATICDGLFGLEGLYKCIDDLLNLPLTQQSLFHHQQEKCVDELLNGSVKLLDICSTIGDFLTQINERVMDLQSTIRRRKGDSSIGISLANFTSFRRKMKREARRLIGDLKQVDSKILNSSTIGLDHHLSTIIIVLREVSSMSISVFQSLLLFLSSPISKYKQSKWSLVSKLILKGSLTHDGQIENMNELENVDSVLCEMENTEGAQKRLEVLRAGIESIETRTECIYRRLIKTRTSILNIISCL